MIESRISLVSNLIVENSGLPKSINEIPHIHKYVGTKFKIMNSPKSETRRIRLFIL